MEGVFNMTGLKFLRNNLKGSEAEVGPQQQAVREDERHGPAKCPPARRARART